MRAKSFVVDPEGTWPIVKAEPGSERDLYRNFILMMAAIPPLCQLIGGGIIGGQGFGAALNVAVISYLIGIISIYLLALVFERLAPLFGGKPSRLNCLRLIAYGYSASYLAGVLNLVPSALVAFIVALLSLYSIYIFYTGISVMTDVPQERRLGFFAASIVAGIVVMFIIGILASPLLFIGAVPEIGA